MYEASVITIDKEGEPIVPYYSQPILKNYVVTYLEKNITRYVTDYDLNVEFFENDGDTVCPNDGFARRVKISLNANINYLFHYNKVQSFSIKERVNYE